MSSCIIFLCLNELIYTSSLFSKNGEKLKCTSLHHVRLFATPLTVDCQAPLSMEFSRQEYWGGLPFPSLGDLPDPGIEPGCPALQTESLLSEPPGKSVRMVLDYKY